MAREPSLLLTDLLMPVMNGVELIVRLFARVRAGVTFPSFVMTAEGQRIIGVDLKSLDIPVLKNR